MQGHSYRLCPKGLRISGKGDTDYVKEINRNAVLTVREGSQGGSAIGRSRQAMRDINRQLEDRKSELP